MGMVCEPLIIIHLSAHLQFMVMVGMAPSLAQAVVVSHGVEVVVESLVAGADSVVGGGNTEKEHKRIQDIFLKRDSQKAEHQAKQHVNWAAKISLETKSKGG
jgi:hypothetical protein